MTDLTWSDCDIAIAGFSNLLNDKEIYKPELTKGNSDMYHLISYCGNFNAIVTFSMYLLVHKSIYNKKSNSFEGILSAYSMGFFLYSTFWYFTKGINFSIIELKNNTKDTNGNIKEQNELLKSYYGYTRSRIILAVVPSMIWILSSTKFFYGLVLLLFAMSGMYHGYRIYPKIKHINEFPSEDIENKLI